MPAKVKPKPKPQKGKTKMATQPAKKPATAAAPARQPAPEPERRVPAVPDHSQAAPPAELLEMMREDKGKGVSTSQSDNLVPLIYVLQALSPQVNRRDASYIQDAEPGAFWVRNAPVEIIAGDPEGDGMVVQSCYFFKDWIEWKPRSAGGGFIARYPSNTDPQKEDVCPVEDAVETEDQQTGRVRLIRPNGNEIIHTRNHVIRVFTPQGVLPYIIPFSSTGHTTSRTWMQLMNTTSGGVGWAAKYKLTTRERSNAAGTWFAVDVKFHSWVSPDDYKLGKQLFEAFAMGEKQAEAPISSGGGAGSGQSGGDIPF